MLIACLPFLVRLVLETSLARYTKRVGDRLQTAPDIYTLHPTKIKKKSTILSALVLCQFAWAGNPVFFRSNINYPSAINTVSIVEVYVAPLLLTKGEN